MINWPPSKAWTSKNKIRGQYHFVLINYGIKEKTYWVNLVSVIDSSICFVMNFDELSDTSLWSPGWLDLGNNITKKDSNLSNNISSRQKILESGCLHPSDDSGLSIGSNAKEFRPWFL